MKLVQITAVAVCATLAVAACQKDGITGNNASGNKLKSGGENDNDVMLAFFDEYQQANTQHFHVRADKGGQVVTEEGVVFDFAPNSLHTPSGEVATGTVDVAIYVASDNSSRALANFTTEAAWDPNQDQQFPLLNSAISFDIQVTSEDGEELSTTADNGVQVDVPSDLSGGTPDPEMVVWEAEPSQDQARDKQWVQREIPVVIDGERYHFTMPLPVSRINLDVRVTDWASAVPFRIAAPSGYTDANMEVFVFFDGYPNMAVTMDRFDAASNIFGEHGGMANLSVSGNILAVGINSTGGLMFYTKSFTTVANDPVTGGFLDSIPSMAPTSTATLDALIAGF